MLDSQERAFWDVFRPMPNCINTTEVDIKKAYRKGGSSLGSGSGSTRIHQNYSVEQLTRHVRSRLSAYARFLRSFFEGSNVKAQIREENHQNIKSS